MLEFFPTATGAGFVAAHLGFGDGGGSRTCRVRPPGAVVHVKPLSALFPEAADLVDVVRLARFGIGGRKFHFALGVRLLTGPDRLDTQARPGNIRIPGKRFLSVKCRPFARQKGLFEIGDRIAGIGCVTGTHQGLGGRRGFFPTKQRATTARIGLTGTARTRISHVDVVVAGAGPAGLTAAIYAVRSGLSAVVLEKNVIGGQVAITPVVENYPGFANVPGKRLMEMIAEQARSYADIHEGEGIVEVKVGKNVEIYTAQAVYVAKALILATGAAWRKLGAPGEERYFGFGVSYCSTCDGYLYRGKKAVVVGGGNTALTDALHLKNLGVDVTVIHRREEFRAEKHLQNALAKEGIATALGAVVAEIMGADNKVTAVRIKDVATGVERELPTDAVFVAIGLNPNTELAEELGLTLTEQGFIKTDASKRTSIPRIYAAGDVSGGAQQIVNAVGDGSTAALSVFEDLSHPYWKKERPA